VSEIPKIARARLAQQAAGTGNHPDADQMTAFLERSLGQREREQVLEHLSRCAVCREVVALALPPEEAARVAQPAPGFRWLEWQTLRWAAVAATFVIAVTLVFQTGWEKPAQPSRETAQNQPVAAPPSTTTEAKPAEPAKADEIQSAAPGEAGAKQKAPSSSTVAVLSDREKEVTRGPSKMDAVTRAKASQKPAEVAAASGGRLDDSKKLGSLGKGEAGGIGGALSTKMAAAAPAPAKATEPKSTSGPAAPAAQQQPVAGLMQQAPPSPAATQEEQHGQPVAGAESSVTALKATERAETVEVTAQNETVTVDKDSAKRARKAKPTESYATGGARLSSAAATTRWIITSEGRVQRTIDNGKTWKEARLDPGIKFRAISATGSDVWAGGEGGTLYHSSDSGDQWTRVALPAELVSATIVRIEFMDARQGSLTTSSGETWATRDGGATWQKN
jgi:hypothetical protein